MTARQGSTEIGCERARLELSAGLDGEDDPRVEAPLEAHVAACPECRRHLAQLQEVKRRLRITPAERVPDLGPAILRRAAALARARRRPEWEVRTRIAAVSGLVAALVLLGTTLPPVPRGSGAADAADIAGSVRRAARALQRYRATYRLTERHWHPLVPVRRFVATVSFAAPERFALQIRDVTRYPRAATWPRNDVDLVANPRRLWLREPSSCPPAALPGCPVPARPEQRSIVRRGPFDGSSVFPSDMVIPLETLAASGGFSVVGLETTAGQASYHIALPYRHAVPLVDALQAGGSWRPFHPLDRVEMWIDEGTWFPLRFRVVAHGSPGRAAWARTAGVAGDSPGEVLLEARATSFRPEVRIPPSTWDAPRSGITTDGGFHRKRWGAVAGPWAPSVPAGLERYRAGVNHLGATVLAYADGMTWLRLVRERRDAGARKTGAPATAEPVPAPDGGVLYYQPASQDLKRRVDVFGRRTHIQLISNLDRTSLLRVAASLDLRGAYAAASTSRDGPTVDELTERSALERFPWALTPRYLPPGYEAGPATATSPRRGAVTLSTYYRRQEAEYQGYGVRVTQSPGMSVLPPPAGRGVIGTRVNGAPARWSPERGELEWIDRGTGDREFYRAVAVPSFDLGTAVRIAKSLGR